MHEVYTKSELPYQGMNNQRVWIEVTGGAQFSVHFVVMLSKGIDYLVHRIALMTSTKLCGRAGKATAMIGLLSRSSKLLSGT